MKENLNNLIKENKIHLMAFVIFLVITSLYMNPVYKGKTINMGDFRNAMGMRHEAETYEKLTGRLPLWTNSMFGGMPTYQIYMKYPANWPNNIRLLIDHIFHYPIDVLLMAMLSFYTLLLSFKVPPPLSIAGALAYAFSSYLFIVIEAGHTSKSFAIAFMPLVLAGMVYLFREKIWLGVFYLLLGIALEISANHVQITYYLSFIVFFFWIAETFRLFKEKKFKTWLIKTTLAGAAALVAILPNATNLLLTEEYGRYTTRGKSELTKDKENKTDGLDKDYAMQWSYGISETFSLLVPDINGGASGAIGIDNKNVLDKINPPQYRQYIAQMDQYWGDQPFTSGPVYVGSVIILLFVIGLFFLPRYYLYWLIPVTLLSIMLAWGKNFLSLNEWMLSHFPLYNKFRAVSMTLVIAELTIPLLAFLTVTHLVEYKQILTDKKQMKKFYYALGIVAGTCIAMIIIPSLFTDFFKEGEYEQLTQLLKNAGFPDYEIVPFLNALQDARFAILKADALRSLFFVLMGALLLWLYIKEKLSFRWFTSTLGLLILIDMWQVNTRYLNQKDFVPKKEYDQPFAKTRADEEILKDTTLHYRVMNLTVSTFNDASTSYFHRSIGGYHGAKFKRYQELIEYHLNNRNMAVLNMLNTRYFIVPDNNQQPKAVFNPDALGNAWCVKEIKWVKNADEEIDALYQFNPRHTLIADERFKTQIPSSSEFEFDSAASVQLISYAPDKLIYTFQSTRNQMVVFSEIYYEKGWKAYIDGNPTSHIRGNYVLRAMWVPAGQHQIVFEFKPETYQNGEKISLAGSILWVILLGISLFLNQKYHP